MSETAEMWRDYKAAQRDERARRREEAPESLTAAGVAFTTHNGGTHLVVTHGGRTVDFWPGTGRWIIRDGGTHGRGNGVRNLLQKLGVGS